jgi:adenine-specific DNA-methyltransferase
MPSETEQILLPYQSQNDDLLETIDKMMRDKKSINEILKITNKKTLKDGYGFTEKEIKLADSIWRKLSARRLNRGK